MQHFMGSALTSGALIQIGGHAYYFSFIVIAHYRLGFPMGIQFFSKSNRSLADITCSGRLLQRLNTL